MKNAMLWGLTVGIVSGFFLRVVPQPVGAVVFFTALSVWTLAGAVVIWRRTRLGWATVAAVAAAVGSLLMARLELFPDWFGDPGLAWLLATGGAALVVLVCLSVETVRNRDEWREWEREMEKVRLWEMFLFRQVPFLRPDEESR